MFFFHCYIDSYLKLLNFIAWLQNHFYIELESIKADGFIKNWHSKLMIEIYDLGWLLSLLESGMHYKPGAGSVSLQIPHKGLTG